MAYLILAMLAASAVLLTAARLPVVRSWQRRRRRRARGQHEMIDLSHRPED